MNENRDCRLPIGLILLLFYHGILVLISLGYSVVGMVELDSPNRLFGGPFQVVTFSCALLVLAGWALVMIFASVGIVRRRPRGFLLGMIGHLLLEIPASVGFLLNFGMFVFAGKGWPSSFLINALVWLPFVLISAWAFFYLGRLRMRLFS
jgi:hypothetical protein